MLTTLKEKYPDCTEAQLLKLIKNCEKYKLNPFDDSSFDFHVCEDDEDDIHFGITQEGRMEAVAKHKDFIAWRATENATDEHCECAYLEAKTKGHHFHVIVPIAGKKTQLAAKKANTLAADTLTDKLFLHLYEETLKKSIIKKA